MTMVIIPISRPAFCTPHGIVRRDDPMMVFHTEKLET